MTVIVKWSHILKTTAKRTFFFFFLVKKQLLDYCEHQINVTPFTVNITDPEGGNFTVCKVVLFFFMYICMQLCAVCCCHFHT